MLAPPLLTDAASDFAGAGLGFLALAATARGGLLADLLKAWDKDDARGPGAEASEEGTPARGVWLSEAERLAGTGICRTGGVVPGMGEACLAVDTLLEGDSSMIEALLRAPDDESARLAREGLWLRPLELRRDIV